MGKDTKRLSYRCSYQNFLLRHICFFILYVAGIGEYCFIVIFPSVHVILRSLSVRQKTALLFLIAVILLSVSLLYALFISSLDKGKQKTNNIIGCQPYTKHRFQQNRSGVFVCVLDIVTRSAPARFHRSVHGGSAGFIPRRRATHSTAGAACQGQSRRCAAVLRTLDWLSRLCYLPRRDGGYILQSRPLSLDRERAGG